MAKDLSDPLIGTSKLPVVAPAFSKMLERMRNNPLDWTIANVETMCRQTGLTCMAPRGGGSHFRVSSEHLQGILTIPAHRPIKRPYILNLIGLADAHIRIAEENKVRETKNGK